MQRITFGWIGIHQLSFLIIFGHRREADDGNLGKLFLEVIFPGDNEARRSQVDLVENQDDVLFQVVNNVLVQSWWEMQGLLKRM